MTNLGQNIKAIRKKHGLTQAQLAQKVGLSTIAIRQYENGLRKPNYVVIEKLAKALDCDISCFLSPNEEAQMIIDSIIEKLSDSGDTPNKSTEDIPNPNDEFIEMYQSPIMQTLGCRWMEQKEKQREAYCLKEGWPFIKCEEPYYSDSINSHIAEILINNGVFPSSYESLISAGILHGTAYLIMKVAKEVKEGKEPTEREIERDEEIGVNLNNIALKQKTRKEADDDAPQAKP